eukprot:m.780112 g.780112  ORF g.780112 m.780112 type:complete len:78 (+) comp23280_c2_seq8:289-522(+)
MTRYLQYLIDVVYLLVLLSHDAVEAGVINLHRVQLFFIPVGLQCGHQVTPTALQCTSPPLRLIQGRLATQTQAHRRS